MTKTAEVVPHEVGTQIAKASDITPRFPIVDLDNAKDLPDLEKGADVMPLELTSSYWEPQAPGETKRVVFSHLEDSIMPGRNGGEDVLVPTAYFFEQIKEKDGTKSILMIRNASKLLTSAIQNNAVQRGTPLQIVYIGEKQFKNGNKGDNWSIKPLLLKS